MFTIQGADGKEYGPVPAAKIHEWINGGRANLSTKAKRMDEGVWKSLGEFAEFAAAPAPTAVAPVHSAPAPAAGVATPAPAGGQLDIMGCIKRGFAKGAANYWPILGVGLLVGLCSSIAGSIPILGILATFTLTGVFYGGLYYYIAKKIRGEPTEIGDAFSGFSVCFGQLVLATFVSLSLTFLGFLCLIIPGIYLAVCWIFTYVLVRDKGLGFWEAMELGRQVITRQWFQVFGLLLMLTLMTLVLFAVPIGLILAAVLPAQAGGTPNLVLVGLGVMGAIICGLGVMPFFSAILLQAYEDLFGSGS